MTTTSDPASGRGLYDLQIEFFGELVQGLEPRARPVRAAAWPHAKKAALFDQQKFHITSARSWDPPAWWTSEQPLPDDASAAWVSAVEASGAGVGDADLHGLLEQLGYQ